jgi:hypothetical protein
MITYFTLGQGHKHSFMDKEINNNTVVRIFHMEHQDARSTAVKLFNNDFHRSFTEDEWDESKMEHFPQGYVDIHIK